MAPDEAPRLALAGGGTGGHVVPGRSLLRGWRAAGLPLADVLWFVSGREVEARVLAGLDPEALGGALAVERLALEPAGGGAPSLPRLLVRLLPAARAARRALLRHRSEVLVGLGGFTSAPAVLAARTLGLPVVLLEVNAVLGRATRFAAPLAARVLHAWPTTLPAAGRGRAAGTDRHVLLGPPLDPAHARGTPDAAESADARRRLGLDPVRPVLLALGGSQGAKGLNEFLRRHAARLQGAGIQVLHQVGPGRAAEGAAEARVVEFLDDVRGALAAATVVLTRGGAGTLAEVAAARRPAFVVPYPHHADRHQERNARLLGGGVRIVQEAALDAAVADELALLAGPAGEARRGEMARALAAAVPLDATERFVHTVLELTGRPFPHAETVPGTPDVD